MVNKFYKKINLAFLRGGLEKTKEMKFDMQQRQQNILTVAVKGRYTLVTLPRNVTPYRDSVDGTCDHVTYQK